MSLQACTLGTPSPNLSVKGVWRGSFGGGSQDELKSRGWAPGRALVTSMLAAALLTTLACKNEHHLHRASAASFGTSQLLEL